MTSPEEFADLQAFSDEMTALVRKIVPSADPVEIRVAIEIHLFVDELSWLDDGLLAESLVEASRSDAAYVEGEEEGTDYVLYCCGLDLEALEALVTLTVGRKYAVSVEDTPAPFEGTRQVRVGPRV